ncbi:hypothetical protein [Pseudomonas luteola]|uniref:hypothetical protein n=1 Tax=Pseudomonas luteola TaxID=47886 RepID=UPI0028A279AB|nr:hypothetical protein [Pseudomonas luteola]
MARRSKTSPFEDLIFIASRLPWWVSLLLAVLSGVILHRYAISPPPVAKDPTQFADALSGQDFIVIASPITIKNRIEITNAQFMYRPN